MAKVTGVNRLVAQFKRLKSKSKKKYNGSVTVGFTQHYALAVHEMVLWKHRVGQAKYLIQPFRTLKSEIRKDIITMVRGGASVLSALFVVGLRVQRQAQKLTPVDTGALRASAFTSDTKKVDAAASAAYRKGEARRAKVLARRAARKTP